MSIRSIDFLLNYSGCIFNLQFWPRCLQIRQRFFVLPILDFNTHSWILNYFIGKIVQTKNELILQEFLEPPFRDRDINNELIDGKTLFLGLAQWYIYKVYIPQLYQGFGKPEIIRYSLPKLLRNIKFKYNKFCGNWRYILATCKNWVFAKALLSSQELVCNYIRSMGAVRWITKIENMVLVVL